MKKILAINNWPAHWWILPDQVLVSGASFVTHLLLAQALGISSYGQFAAVLLVQLFFLSLHQASVSGILQVVYPHVPAHRQRAYSGGLFWGQAIALTALLLIASLFAFIGEPPYRALWVPGIILIFLSVTHDYLRKVLLTQGSYQQAFLIDLVANGLQLVLLAGLSLWGKMNAAAALWVIGLTFVPSIAMGALWIGAWRLSAWGMQYAWLKHRQQMRWLLPAALLQWATGNYFIVAAGWYLGAAALGALRLSQYLFGPVNLLFQALENYFLPQAAALQRQPAQLSAFALRLLRRSAWIFLPILLAIALAGPSILELIGGAEVAAYTYVCRGLALVYLLVWLGYPIRMVLRASLLNRTFFSGYAWAAVFSLAAAPMLISNFALWGVMSGLGIIQFIMSVYWLLSLLRRQNLQPQAIQ